MIFRVLFLVLLTLFGGMAAGQDLKETQGKTYAEIRRMGREAWFDYYTGKMGGQTTIAMASAQQLFANALFDGNELALKKLPAHVQLRIRARRELMLSVEHAVIAAHARMGGSMWSLEAASNQVDLEEAVGRMIAVALSKTPVNAKAVEQQVSDVVKNLQTIERAVVKEEVTEFFSRETKRSIITELGLARRDVANLKTELLRGNGAESRTLMAYLLKLTKPDKYD